MSHVSGNDAEVPLLEKSEVGVEELGQHHRQAAFRLRLDEIQLLQLNAQEALVEIDERVERNALRGR